MSLTFAQIEALYNEIKALILGSQCLDFFEIGSRKFVLLLSKSDQIIKLLLCFQEPYLRFHLGSEKYKRQESSFSHEILVGVKGKDLIEIGLLNEDRILSLVFQKGGHYSELICEFFPKKPNLYLLNRGKKILTAMRNPGAEVYSLPPKPQHQKQDPVELASGQVEQLYRQKEEEGEFQEKKNQARGGIEKAIARIQKQQKQRKQQLEICQKWQEVQQEGLLLQANMYRLKKGMEQISVTDWESGEEKVIELDPRFEPKVEVERRFRQAKRLKSGLEYAENDLIRLELEVQKWKEKQLAVEQVHSYEELEQFLPAKEIKPVAGLPYREYFSQSGYQIWVGKSGSKNEELTFKHAKGLDWWFHIADYPGSHVVLKTTKGEEPDIEAIQDACQLALRYSKAKELSEADVCYTLCKFVSRMGRKGKAGKVQISKHKLMRVRIDDERWKRISQSSSSLKR